MSEQPRAGTTREATLKIIDVLVSRFEAVESLLEGPKDKRELVEELGISRSTVDRATRELETAGLVEHAGGEFAVSPMGRSAAAELSDLVETIQLGQRLEAFLEWVPMEEFDIDPRLFADAEIVLAEPGDPWSMINRHVQVIKRTERSRGILPFTGLHATEAANEQVVHNGARGELVVEPEIADLYRSAPEYTELWEEMTATGRFELFVYDGTIPYALCVFDDTVQIVVAEGDEPRALLETDSEEVRVWAEAEYRDYKENATRMSL